VITTTSRRAKNTKWIGGQLWKAWEWTPCCPLSNFNLLPSELVWGVVRPHCLRRRVDIRLHVLASKRAQERTQIIYSTMLVYYNITRYKVSLRYCPPALLCCYVITLFYCYIAKSFWPRSLVLYKSLLRINLKGPLACFHGEKGQEKPEKNKKKIKWRKEPESNWGSQFIVTPHVML
jgi:hypothetical protein